MGISDFHSRCITKTFSCVLNWERIVCLTILVVKTKIKGYFSRKAISIRENCNSPGKMLGHSRRNRWEEKMWAQEIKHWHQHMQISAERRGARKALRKCCSMAYFLRTHPPLYGKVLSCWIVCLQMNLRDFCWKGVFDEVVWECTIKYKSQVGCPLAVY